MFEFSGATPEQQTKERHFAIDSLEKHEADHLQRFFTENTQQATKHTERIQHLQSICENDPEGQKLIGDVEEYALRYIESIANAESRLKIARHRLEGPALRELSESLDRRRSLAHDTLIDSIKICNRHLLSKYSKEEIPDGGILSIDTVGFAASDEKQRRRIIGDWAVQLINEELSLSSPKNPQSN